MQMLQEPEDCLYFILKRNFHYISAVSAFEYVMSVCISDGVLMHFSTYSCRGIDQLELSKHGWTEGKALVNSHLCMQVRRTVRLEKLLVTLRFSF